MILGVTTLQRKLFSPADYIYKQFEPRQGRPFQTVWHSDGLFYFLKANFKAYLPSMQRVKKESIRYI